MHPLTSWLLIGGVLEVVETLVVQYEPSSLPVLIPAALLEQPALPVWIEKGVHQIVAVVFGYLERLLLDALVQADQQLSGQVTAVVYSSIHQHELVQGRLIFDARIVQGGVQHDDRETARTSEAL